MFGKKNHMFKWYMVVIERNVDGQSRKRNFGYLVYFNINWLDVTTDLVYFQLLQLYALLYIYNRNTNTRRVVRW